MAKKKYFYLSANTVVSNLVNGLENVLVSDSWDSFLELNEVQQEVLKQTITANSSSSKARPTTEILQDDVSRFSSFNYEFDLVLGGGVVLLKFNTYWRKPRSWKINFLLKVAGSIAKEAKSTLCIRRRECWTDKTKSKSS